ncbi:hypothetical protein BOX15_Mlig023761g4, partial [Macrostomum lignano]
MSKNSVYLVLAATLAAICAVSDATQLCLDMQTAIQAEAANVVICGFPRSSYSTGGIETARIPVACHRKATGIASLLQAEAGYQNIQDSMDICFMSLKPNDEGITIFNIDLVEDNYGDAFKKREICLQDSVAEIVGISSGFAIKGPISSINPAVFADTGSPQRAQLKNLYLAFTELQTLDLSLLKPLNLQELFLVNNSKLTRIVNYKDAPMSDLTTFISWNNNPSLIDCRNLLGLPSTITKIGILQKGLNNSCAQCHLPKKCELLVRMNEPELKYFPGLGSQSQNFPFPMEHMKFRPATFLPEFVPYKSYNIAPETTKAATCQTECSCQKWPPP